MRLPFIPVLCVSIAAAGSGSSLAVEVDAGPFTHPVNRDADAPLVALDESDGRLHYGLYRERGAPIARNIVPDFSRAGYRGGGVALPAREHIPVRIVLAARADGDDHARIQQAIDAVGRLAPDARGIRGAVLLRHGHYRIAEGLVMRTGGVVLRGEGRGEAGTVIRSTYAGPQGAIIEVGNRESPVPKAAADARRTLVTSDFVPVGAMRIAVESTAGYHVGDSIAVVRQPNAEWVDAKGVDTARYGWEAKDYVMYYERVVTAVAGNMLGLDAPMVDGIDQLFGGASVYRTDTRRIREAGIEDLRLEGNPETGIAVGTPDDGPYTGIRVGGVRDSWVRSVTVRYVSHGITARDGAHFNTFEDVAYLDPRYGETQGVRRYVFDYEGNAAFNLTQRCYGEHGRHTFVTGARVPGPNVFLDCLAVDASNDSGPHHRWATGTLYDNTRDQQLRVQNRRRSGSGHGWAGAQQMFWNTGSTHYVLQAPPHAMNWSVGEIGVRVPGKFPPEEPAGMALLRDRVVLPRSLYLQQLRDRLGEQAVIDITTAAQRQGRVWDVLASRRGE